MSPTTGCARTRRRCPAGRASRRRAPQGRPFMESIRENKALLRAAVACYAVLALALTGVSADLNDLLQLTDMPSTQVRRRETASDAPRCALTQPHAPAVPTGADWSGGGRHGAVRGHCAAVRVVLRGARAAARLSKTARAPRTSLLVEHELVAAPPHKRTAACRHNHTMLAHPQLVPHVSAWHCHCDWNMRCSAWRSRATRHASCARVLPTTRSASAPRRRVESEQGTRSGSNHARCQQAWQPNAPRRSASGVVGVSPRMASRKARYSSRKSASPNTVSHSLRGRGRECA